MNREEIYKKIKEIISITFKGEASLDNVTEDTNLPEELGINSVVCIELIVRVEKEFGFEVEDEELSLELIRTMSVLADYIESKTNL